MMITPLILMSIMELGMCLGNVATKEDDLKRRKNPQAIVDLKKKNDQDIKST